MKSFVLKIVSMTLVAGSVAHADPFVGMTVMTGVGVAGGVTAIGYGTYEGVQYARMQRNTTALAGQISAEDLNFLGNNLDLIQTYRQTMDKNPAHISDIGLRVISIVKTATGDADLNFHECLDISINLFMRKK